MMNKQTDMEQLLKMMKEMQDMVGPEDELTQIIRASGEQSCRSIRMTVQEEEMLSAAGDPTLGSETPDKKI